MSKSRSAIVEVHDAAFGYGGRPIIFGVNLRIHAGDLLGIVGPNGSGKTTLFRGLLGLIRPMRGELSRTRASIGYVPQREELDSLFPLNVREVVEMGSYGRVTGARRFWRSPSKLERSKVAECLEFVGLRDLENQLLSDLSGGQRQRVLLARALMTDPQLLMLDEPTAGVDRGAASEIFARIRELNSDRGVAVLLVAHQLDQVRELAPEVLLVRDGGVERGPSERLLSSDSIESLFSGGSLA